MAILRPRHLAQKAQKEIKRKILVGLFFQW
jgi:hypothetical protein